MNAHIDDLTWLKNNIYGRSWHKFKGFLEAQIASPAASMRYNTRLQCIGDWQLINGSIEQAKKKGR